MKTLIFFHHKISFYRIFFFFNLRSNLFYPLPTKSLSLIHIAAYADNLEAFLFLQKKGLLISLKTRYNYLPIHYACASGSTEIVSYILSIDSSQAKENYHTDIFFLSLFVMIYYIWPYFQINTILLKFYYRKDISLHENFL